AEAPRGVTADFSKGPATVKADGTDTLTGISTVVGSPFDDTFIPGPADETFDGGGGTNTLSYQDQAAAGEAGAPSLSLPDPATVDLAAGTATAPGRGHDTI